jgi:hypothetical protein
MCAFRGNEGMAVEETPKLALWKASHSKWFQLGLEDVTYKTRYLMVQR